MATEFTTVEVWVMIGEDGQYSAHTDEDALQERFEEECPDAGKGRRVVKIAVKVPLPAVVELAGEVSEEPATGELHAA